MSGSEPPFDRRIARQTALLSVAWLTGMSAVYTAVFYVWHGHVPW